MALYLVTWEIQIYGRYRYLPPIEIEIVVAGVELTVRRCRYHSTTVLYQVTIMLFIVILIEKKEI